MSNELTITQAQQKVIDLQEREGKLKFIPWGGNYFRVMNKDSVWLSGRVRFETFDALKRKSLLL